MSAAPYQRAIWATGGVIMIQKALMWAKLSRSSRATAISRRLAYPVVTGRWASSVWLGSKASGTKHMNPQVSACSSPMCSRRRTFASRAKLDNEGWFEVARAVHAAGLPSNATLLYGHIETQEEKVRHLLHIRELQDETGGGMCFVPPALA